MLKEKIKDSFKQYLLIIIGYIFIAFIATYFFDNKLALSKDNLLVVLGGISGGYLVGILIIYNKYK